MVEKTKLVGQLEAHFPLLGFGGGVGSGAGDDGAKAGERDRALVPSLFSMYL